MSLTHRRVNMAGTVFVLGCKPAVWCSVVGQLNVGVCGEVCYIIANCLLNLTFECFSSFSLAKKDLCKL